MRTSNPLASILFLTLQKIKVPTNVIVPLIQVICISIYFGIYYTISYISLETAIVVSGIYAGWFCFIEIMAWPNALKALSESNELKYLVFTIATSFSAPILFFASIYLWLGELSCGAEKCSLDLWESIYFSVTTFTTLGYGEITPVGFSRIASSFEALLGMGYFAFIIGISASISHEKLTNKSL